MLPSVMLKWVVPWYCWYPESGVTDFVDLSNLKWWNNGLCELQAWLFLLLLLLAGFCQHFLNCYSLFLLLNFFTDQLLYFVLCWLNLHDTNVALNSCTWYCFQSGVFLAAFYVAAIKMMFCLYPYARSMVDMFSIVVAGAKVWPVDLGHLWSPKSEWFCWACNCWISPGVVFGVLAWFLQYLLYNINSFNMSRLCGCLFQIKIKSTGSFSWCLTSWCGFL